MSDRGRTADLALRVPRPSVTEGSRSRCFATQLAKAFTAWCVRAYAALWALSGTEGGVSDARSQPQPPQNVPKEYGGYGLMDPRYGAIVNEETVRAGVDGFLAILGTDMVLPYLLNYGSAAQKAEWLPRVARYGTLLCAPASAAKLTAGSDGWGGICLSQGRRDPWGSDV